MKTALFLILISATGALPSRADDNTSGLDFTMFIDRDAVAKAIANPAVPSFEPPPPLPVPEDLETKKKAFDDREWLMREYAAQLRERAKSGSASDQADLDGILAEKDNLARAAGFSPAEIEKMAEEEKLAAGDETPKEKPKAAAETDLAPKSTPGATSFLKPFLATDKTVAPLPFSEPSPVFSPLTVPFAEEADKSLGLSANQDSPEVDNSAMDVPGMTAAKSNPSSLESMDLNEPLPSEAKSGANSSLELELPSARNIDRLQAMQDETLGIPGQVVKKTPVTPPQPLLLLPPETATQQMVRDPSPIRTRVADPYDILR